jgi:MoaA/NifB/PqqE/SkfB family radical SAM enzyme
LPGFEEFIDEAAEMTGRPIISISTNGTLINNRWAEKIVDIPFQEVTVSIDGATAATYEYLRRGARLDDVLANVDRIQNIKSRRNSAFPSINFFYVVVRSNYREIPQFLQLARAHGVSHVCFQTALVDHRNLSRDPTLAGEAAFGKDEIRELYEIIRVAIREQRSSSGNIGVSGMHQLFQSCNLGTAFLEEDKFSIYPGRVVPGVEPTDDSDEIELCPNPWTTVFVSEGGDVHLCFGSLPVGNIYETPLVRIWNCQKAIAARSEMLRGRYFPAGCSRDWCSWREGKRSKSPAKGHISKPMTGFWRRLIPSINAPEESAGAAFTTQVGISPVRRLLTQRSAKIAELESRVQLLESIATLSGAEVPLSKEVRFGSSTLSKFAKKIEIGAAVRMIQLLQRIINALKRFINWVCIA